MLVVDDDNFFRKIILQVLRDLGYTDVLEAERGPQYQGYSTGRAAYPASACIAGAVPEFLGVVPRSYLYCGPWNKGKLTGQKPPLKLKEIWAIRIRLQLGNHTRGLALFNLAIDSKLRGCDLVALRVKDVAHGGQIARRAIILQRKTQRPVQFEITDQTRESLATWIAKADLKPE
ncbi:hypothetical protein [Acidithiobacillus sp.]|uniref:hypothetical protein n=1 Tax=Acidithiobacillus sp. TaxID=1872118 RepID=UPI0025B90D7C|nr:hypothetical protein [Acidithiobacillus sp.]